MTDTRIRFRHLQCFLSIAQLRGVGTAANALAITQPALSKTLRELEQSLGAKLFERDRKGMLLTRAGELFLQHAAASLASMREGVAVVRRSRHARGVEIRIGALPNVVASLVPKAVRALKKDAIDTTIRIVTGENSRLLDQLRVGELDLVVGRLAQPEYLIGLAFEHLYSEPLMAVVRRGHPLTRVARFKLGMIGDYPCLMPHHGTIIRHEIDRFLLTEGVKQPRNLVETTSLAFGLAYLHELDAVWFVPSGFMDTRAAQRTLTALPLDTSRLQGPVGITTRADAKLVPGATMMIEAIRMAARGPGVGRIAKSA